MNDNFSLMFKIICFYFCRHLSYFKKMTKQWCPYL